MRRRVRRACGSSSNSEPGRAVAYDTPPFVAMMLRHCDGIAMLLPQEGTERDQLRKRLTSKKMPPSHCGQHSRVTGCWFPKVLLKKVKRSSIARRNAVSGRGIRDELVPPAQVAEDVKAFRTMSSQALLSLTVGVGAQLSSRLAPLSFANLASHDQEGHLAIVRDVRDVTERQVNAVADAVSHLHALHRVLLCRLADAHEDVLSHEQSDRACRGCRARR